MIFFYVSKFKQYYVALHFDVLWSNVHGWRKYVVYLAALSCLIKALGKSKVTEALIIDKKSISFDFQVHTVSSSLVK